MVIDGKALANTILDDLERRVGELKKIRIQPHLGVILVGNDASSAAYVRQKELKAKQVGIKLSVFRFEETVTEKNLLQQVNILNSDILIHGIIIQRPLPKHIDGEKITLATTPDKDVDGFHPKSPFSPPVALAIEQILRYVRQQINTSTLFDEWLKNKNLVIVGKGQTAGTPIISYFQKKNIFLTVIDSKTENKSQLLKEADIVISAVGKPHTLKSSELKRGVVLIGVGMDKEDQHMHPDYDEKDMAQIASFYTPVPGGVGPVNVAMLLSNLIDGTERQKA